MDVKKIQVCAYAIGKRIQGYHLLKNPKGTSPYQVNMIKSWEGISYELDTFSIYDRVSKDFSADKSKTIKQHLHSEKNMFWNKDGKEIKKSRLYSKSETDKPFVFKKLEIPYEELENRDLSYINKERFRGYRDDVDFSMSHLGYCNLQRVPNYTSIREEEISNFFNKQHKKADSRKTTSFWSVLIKNLTNK